MTAAEHATDAIERLLQRLAPPWQIVVGVALIAVGLAASAGIARWLGRTLPRPAPTRAFHPLLLPLSILVFLLAFKLGGNVVASGSVAVPDGQLPDLRASAIVGAVVAAALFGFLAWWTTRFGDGLRDLGLSTRQLAPSLRLALALYATCIPLQLGAVALEHGLWLFFGRDPPAQQVVVAFAQDPALHGDLLVIAAIVVFAPLCEELLFRGVIQHCLTRVLPAWPAIVATALLFALQHDAGRLAGFALGAALGWLMLRTGNLFAPLLFHAVHNGLVLLLIANSPKA